MKKIERIQIEIKKLTSIFKDIDEDKMKLLKHMISNIAFQIVTLEDLQDEINNSPIVDDFRQGNQEYKKEAAALKSYNTLIKNFNASVKQVLDYLPEKQEVEEDVLSKFIKR